MIDQCLTKNVKFEIADDINIDILCMSKECKMFLGILEMCNLQVTVITLTTATYLENIISNFQGVTSVIEEFPSSDHYGQKFMFLINFSSVEKNNERSIRKYNDHNHQMSTVQQLLLDIDWSKLYSISNNITFHKVSEYHFP